MREAAERFLVEAAARPPGDEFVLSIREFISKWGAQRRGYWWVQEINDDLARHKLTTMPPFEVGYIDNQVRILHLVTQARAETANAVASDATESGPSVGQLEEPSLSVSTIESASKGVKSVSRDDSLAKAQSLMLQGDYSQLAVLGGERDLHGAISWESIAQARMHNGAASVRECMVPTESVALDDDLLALIPRVISQGFVFVRRADRTVAGIITGSSQLRV